MLAAHPLNAGPIGVTGCTSANALAAEADVVIAVGTRLQDFTTGSWTAFCARRPGSSASTSPASTPVKRLAHAVVGDARECLRELAPIVDDWSGPSAWSERTARETQAYHAYIDKIATPTEGGVADLRPGRRCGRSPRRAERLRAGGGGWASRAS